MGIFEDGIDRHSYYGTHNISNKSKDCQKIGLYYACYIFFADKIKFVNCFKVLQERQERKCARLEQSVQEEEKLYGAKLSEIMDQHTVSITYSQVHM